MAYGRYIEQRVFLGVLELRGRELAHRRRIVPLLAKQMLRRGRANLTIASGARREAGMARRISCLGPGNVVDASAEHEHQRRQKRTESVAADAWPRNDDQRTHCLAGHGLIVPWFSCLEMQALTPDAKAQHVLRPTCTRRASVEVWKKSPAQETLPVQ